MSISNTWDPALLSSCCNSSKNIDSEVACIFTATLVPFHRHRRFVRHRRGRLVLDRLRLCRHHRRRLVCHRHRPPRHRCLSRCRDLGQFSEQRLLGVVQIYEHKCINNTGDEELAASCCSKWTFINYNIFIWHFREPDNPDQLAVFDW